jgi:putative iron-dependent peroxidase
MSQNAIFMEGSTSTVFLEFKINTSVDIVKLKKTLIKVYEMSTDQLQVLMSFSKSGYNKLGAIAPNGLVDFEELIGLKNLKMPSSQSEIFIWAHSFSKSEIFDFSLKSKKILHPFLTVELEQEGFRYHDSRDLTGFVDGSANPKGNKRMQEVLVPKGEKHENGSFVITQKWIHNLPVFHSHKTEEQEKIIGRTKESSIELEGSEMPKNSHVSSVDLKVDGEAMKIYRRSFPYANSEDKGLFFLGFAKNIQRFDVQLKSMLGLSEDGISDRIMDFSTPETGGYYFAPSMSELLKILTPN